MKTAIKNIILLVGLISIPASLSATVTSQSDATEFDRVTFQSADIETLPFPTHRATPSIHSGNLGTRVWIKMTITEEGVPTRITTTEPRLTFDSIDQSQVAYSEQMADIVGAWTFEPTRDSHGNPVAATVLMPVRVIDHDGTQLAQVGVILDQPVSELAQL